MQWLFLSEGTNQLFSLILKLKQVKTSEKSSEIKRFLSETRKSLFSRDFSLVLRVSASKSRREKLICTRLQKKPLHFPIYPIGRSFLSFMCYILYFWGLLINYIID